MTRKTLGHDLAEIRRARQLSQRALGTLTQLHPSAISHFERGSRYPTIPNLITLALVLDIDLNHLLKPPNPTLAALYAAVPGGRVITVRDYDLGGASKPTTTKGASNG